MIDRYIESFSLLMIRSPIDLVEGAAYLLCDITPVMVASGRSEAKAKHPFFYQPAISVVLQILCRYCLYK
jgi:hypothetical protein